MLRRAEPRRAFPGVPASGRARADAPLRRGGARPGGPTVVVDRRQAAGRSRPRVQSFARASAPTLDAAALRDGIQEGLEFSSLFASVARRLPRDATSARRLARAARRAPTGGRSAPDALVEGVPRREAGVAVGVDFEAWDVARCQKLVAKQLLAEARSDAKRLARRIADDVVGAFTGKPGVASTEIAFISNRGRQARST